VFAEMTCSIKNILFWKEDRPREVSVLSSPAHSCLADSDTFRPSAQIRINRQVVRFSDNHSMPGTKAIQSPVSMLISGVARAAGYHVNRLGRFHGGA
jgi:hypothetical protein